MTRWRPTKRKVDGMYFQTFDDASNYAAQFVKGWPAWQVELVELDSDQFWVIALLPNGPYLSVQTPSSFILD